MAKGSGERGGRMGKTRSSHPEGPGFDSQTGMKGLYVSFPSGFWFPLPPGTCVLEQLTP